jgi:malonyl CoA-acyl carrier protein transacylase
MAALIGASLEQIDDILPELNEHGKIYIANDNANGQVVLSGEISALIIFVTIVKNTILRGL